MDDELRHRLTATTGPSGVTDGNRVRPSNLTQLREVLAACTAAGAGVAPQGFPGAEEATVVIDAERLDAITVDPGALLLHAGAAATWVTVREAAGAMRFAVAGLPALRSETTGRSVSLGEIAHRTLAGVDILTPGGRLISAGGRTLKDVVGYDLAGLALGSGDRLGIIVAVTLRLEPAAARTPALPGGGPWRGDAGLDLAAAFLD